MDRYILERSIQKYLFINYTRCNRLKYILRQEILNVLVWLCLRKHNIELTMMWLIFSHSYVNSSQISYKFNEMTGLYRLYYVTWDTHSLYWCNQFYTKNQSKPFIFWSMDCKRSVLSSMVQSPNIWISPSLVAITQFGSQKTEEDKTFKHYLCLYIKNAA